MPYMGLGLHVVVAIFFAIHAIRNGRELYWLFILFMFPVLGSIVYFFAVFLPNTRVQHGVNLAFTAASKIINPGKVLREAQVAYELAPTAQNRLHFAKVLLESGETQQAATHFEACLRGPLADDAEIRFGAALSRFKSGDLSESLSLINEIITQSVDYHPERTYLLRAKILSSLGRNEEAKRDFEYCYQKFSAIEVKVGYAIWALHRGESELADRIHDEIKQSMRHWNKHAHKLNRSSIGELKSAFSNRATK